MLPASSHDDGNPRVHILRRFCSAIGEGLGATVGSWPWPPAREVSPWESSVNHSSREDLADRPGAARLRSAARCSTGIPVTLDDEESRAIASARFFFARARNSSFTGASSGPSAPERSRRPERGLGHDELGRVHARRTPPAWAASPAALTSPLRGEIVAFLVNEPYLDESGCAPIRAGPAPAPRRRT